MNLSQKTASLFGRALTLGLVLLFIVISGAFAANDFILSNAECKDLVNDGAAYYINSSIPNPATVEKWRDRIQFQVTDPNGVPFNWTNYYPSDMNGDGTSESSIVEELTLYAASDTTAYQCQQLAVNTTDAGTFAATANTFSCNSFPKGGTIARIAVRFKPNFTSKLPNPGAVIPGKYALKVINLNVPTDTLFEGTATFDAVSTACAWNMSKREWVPNTPTTTEFLFNTHKFKTCFPSNNWEVLQSFEFKDTPGNEFTIVSFPLNETVDENRFRFYGDQVVKEFNYNVVLQFRDNIGNRAEFTYTYTKNTDPKDGTTNPLTFVKTDLAFDWNNKPIKFHHGTIFIHTTGINTATYDKTKFTEMPNLAKFKFTLYYQNIDPTLGFENSMFHFQREMMINFGLKCKTSRMFRTINGAYDPCSTAKQVFTIDFRDAAGVGYIVRTDPENLRGADADMTLIQNSATLSGATARNMHFDAEYCKNATCTDREPQSGTYIHRVYVDDGEIDNRWWHYTEQITAHSRSFSKIPMRTFQNLPREFEVKEMHVTVNRAGTYFVRAFIPHFTTTGANPYPNNYWMGFYLTVPEKSADLTCSTSGADGFYKMIWDDCFESYHSQTQEFKAVEEKYSHVSNYSPKAIDYKFNGEKSSMTGTANIVALDCEFQPLVDGVSVEGAKCERDRIILPPFVRAIVKGGKIEFPFKPGIHKSDTLNEFTMAFVRETTMNTMNLFINMTDQECPREPIPDTGYSLRSPAPKTTADQSGFIFTGNTLQIPAIGLGMEYPIDIVHINYLNGTDLSGGYDLKVLGGYIGELEGGAYLPYPGNTVLTGHYYSKGVFVNLTNLHMDDEIYIYGTDGMKYTYRVNNSFWTEPDDAYMMFQPNGERSLTLVTCDDYNFVEDKYLKRYIVQATIDSIEPYVMP